MTRWGGHQNGRIPLAALTYVGIGVMSGQPQYLHPAVAIAWRALQADFKQLGVNLLITEGYRTLELQRAYRERWESDPENQPTAARPGTSNHGWATAIDMANYTGLSPSERRPLIRARGFSLATGDAVREPWHIEYVGSLALAGTPGTPIQIPKPDQPASPEIEEEDMPKNSGFSYKTASGQTVHMVVNTGSGFIAEHSGVPDDYNRDLRVAFDTESWSWITEAHARVIRRACAAVAAKGDVTVNALITGGEVASISDEDLQRIAAAAADEQARRLSASK